MSPIYDIGPDFKMNTIPILLVSSPGHTNFFSDNVLNSKSRVSEVAALDTNFPIARRIGDIQIVEQKNIIIADSLVDCALHNGYNECMIKESALATLLKKKPEKNTDFIFENNKYILEIRKRTHKIVTITVGNINFINSVNKQPDCIINIDTIMAVNHVEQHLI